MERRRKESPRNYRDEIRLDGHQVMGDPFQFRAVGSSAAVV